MDDASRGRLNNRLLLVILIGAAWLRLLHIDQPFVDLTSWRETDDAIIADNFFRGHFNIFLPEISWNGPGPNYVGYEFQLTTYLTALLYRVFGQADWVGRGVSVAFGIWGIFAFYNLVRRAFNEERAIVSSAVLAVMPGGRHCGSLLLARPGDGVTCCQQFLDAFGVLARSAADSFSIICPNRRLGNAY